MFSELNEILASDEAVRRQFNRLSLLPHDWNRTLQESDYEEYVNLLDSTYSSSNSQFIRFVRNLTAHSSKSLMQTQILRMVHCLEPRFIAHLYSWLNRLDDSVMSPALLISLGYVSHLFPPITKAQTPAKATPTPTPTDHHAMLVELNEFHNEGIIDEIEFNQTKAQLLKAILNSSM